MPISHKDKRAVKGIPRSYKLWHGYLLERLELARKFPIDDPEYEAINVTFESALVTMHMMPRIWLMYLQNLMDQKLITRTLRTFDRALSALPVRQHDRVWKIYVAFVKTNSKEIPVETQIRVYQRYLDFEPSHIEDYIIFLVDSKLYQEAAERLVSVLNDDRFRSGKGKTKKILWLELCDLLTKNATEISGVNVDGIIREGIGMFKDEACKLWISLAEYYLRMGMHEKARDVFEEAMQTVVTVRDFSFIFNAYTQFEEIFLEVKMEYLEDDEDEEGEEDDDFRTNVDLSLALAEFKRKTLLGFWLHDDKDVDLRISRLDQLMDRRPELVSSVVLRQNPNDVEQWHQGVKLFEDNSTKQILTYTQAMKAVDPKLAVGNPNTLWIALAKLYETQGDIANARGIFEKAVQVNYKETDDLASVWCEWAEMEIRNKNSAKAFQLMSVATWEPSAVVKQRVAESGGDEPVEMKLYKSLKLWSLYVDLVEIFGTLESTRAAYERMIDLRIATPLTIINYACLLEEHDYLEDSFRVFERGTHIFKYPHVKDIWITYLSRFVKLYGNSKMERARGLFEDALEAAPASEKKAFYLQYAKLEEDYGLTKRAMKIYCEAIEAVPDYDKLSIYEIYTCRAAENLEIYGIPKIREIYVKAIESDLPHKDVKNMCLKYIEFEVSLDEIDRARGVYVYASQFSNPQSDADFWNEWREFEVQYGNEGTFRELLKMQRTVSASFTSQKKDIPFHKRRCNNDDSPERITRQRLNL